MFQTNPLFSFREVAKWSPESGKALLFMAYLMTPILQPQLFQRMVMARDTAQLKRSFGYAAIVSGDRAMHAMDRHDGLGRSARA